MTYEKRAAWELRLILLPSVLLIGALVVYPALYSIYLSLTNAALVGPAATPPALRRRAQLCAPLQ